MRRAVVVLAMVAVEAAREQVSELRVRHREGQTILTWKEVGAPELKDDVSVPGVRGLKRKLAKERRVFYRTHRSEKRITSVDGLKPIAEVPPLTVWNTDYYGICPRPLHKAFRYVVDEGEGAVPPGTGIYAHNPEKEGKAYYAVTVVRNGEENTETSDANSTAEPVEESVGPGSFILQRMVNAGRFQYIQSATRYYFIRWEAPPRCSVESKPFDYVVAIAPKLAHPAPVGIHLHCWGRSLSGGYG